MPSDLYWSIYPQAENDAAARVAAYLRHLAEKGPDAGPANDASRDGLPVHVDGALAIVPLMGVMMRRAGPYARYFGIAGTDATRMAIESAIADPDVERVLLRIDSPGGSVSGIDELADTVARADKPIVAVVEGMCASAAYWVASHADRIVAGKNDLVGSIGARIMLYDYSQYFEEAGIEAVPIDTGKFKSAGALGTKITDEQRADFQRIVDYYGDAFVKSVSRGRNMAEPEVQKLADGRVFTQPEALAAGLIDGVSTYGETLREMRGSSQRRTDTSRARLSL